MLAGVRTCLIKGFTMLAGIKGFTMLAGVRTCFGDPGQVGGRVRRVAVPEERRTLADALKSP